MGILHRDIKPSNLLLDRAGKVWVSDFGLVHVPAAESMTFTGDVMGTIRYMSPEQAAGRTQFVDHRSDIYSLGITLYEMATLTRAFASDNREDFLRRIATEEPLAPRRLNRSIPLDLETIILKAVAKEPTDRYASAQAFADDLRCFLDGRSTLARRPTLVERAAKWTRRHRRLVMAGMLALALLAPDIQSGGLEDCGRAAENGGGRPNGGSKLPQCPGVARPLRIGYRLALATRPRHGGGPP